VKIIIDYKNGSQQNVKGVHKVFRKQTFESSSPTKLEKSLVFKIQ